MKVLRTSAELAQAHELIRKSVYKLNPFWVELPPDIDEANTHLDYMITESSKYDLVWAYYAENRMAGVIIGYPAQQYLRLDPPKCPKSKLMQYMLPYEAKLNQLLKEHITEREGLDMSLVHDWLAVDPDCEGKKIGMKLLYHTLKQLHDFAHWKYLYGVMINPVSLKTALKLSYRIIAEVTLEEQFKDRKMQLVKSDMRDVQRVLQLKEFTELLKS